MIIAACIWRYHGKPAHHKSIFNGFIYIAFRSPSGQPMRRFRWANCQMLPKITTSIKLHKYSAVLCLLLKCLIGRPKALGQSRRRRPERSVGWQKRDLIGSRKSFRMEGEDLLIRLCIFSYQLPHNLAYKTMVLWRARSDKYHLEQGFMSKQMLWKRGPYE